MLSSALNEAAGEEDKLEAKRARIITFLRARGREMKAFLEELVRERGIPPMREGNRGGLVVAGWSLGMVWMTALLEALTKVTRYSASMVNALRL